MTNVTTFPTVATFAKQIAVLMSNEQWEDYRQQMMRTYNVPALTDNSLEHLLIANNIIDVNQDHNGLWYIGYDNMRAYVFPAYCYPSELLFNEDKHKLARSYYVCDI